jgi:hypothetical protein
VKNEIGDDDPIPLAEAAELFFRGHLTKSSLRREASKGNLEIIRIANKDFVTKRGIEQMIERCKLPASAPPTSKQPQGITAQEALAWRLDKLANKPK